MASLVALCTYVPEGVCVCMYNHHAVMACVCVGVCVRGACVCACVCVCVCARYIFPSFIPEKALAHLVSGASICSVGTRQGQSMTAGLMRLGRPLLHTSFNAGERENLDWGIAVLGLGRVFWWGEGGEILGEGD